VRYKLATLSRGNEFEVEESEGGIVIYYKKGASYRFTHDEIKKVSEHFRGSISNLDNDMTKKFNGSNGVGWFIYNILGKSSPRPASNLIAYMEYKGIVRKVNEKIKSMEFEII